MAHDLFISYSSKDKNLADAVCARMETGGIRCWYAPRDIEPGSDWAGSIVDAINNSKVLVLIFTANSNISKQVLREVDCAVAAGIPVIPMRMSDTEPEESMKYYLSAVHWIDAVDEELEDSVEELYQVCKAVVETRAAALPPTEIEKKKKRFTWKAGAALALAAVLIFFGVRYVKKTLRSSGVITAKSFSPLGADSPVGELSPNCGTEPPYLEGTDPGNIRAGGYIAYSDGWYYFRSNDDEKLYRINEDGTGVQKLSDHSAKFIYVYDGYVYFEEEHNYVGIYRVSVDGEDERQLFGYDVPYMSLVGDKLYYLDYSDGLCAIDLTQEFDYLSWGGDEVFNDSKVLDDIFDSCFDGEYIYYNQLKKKGLYRVSINGGDPEKIVNGETYDPVLYGDWLFYSDLDDGSIKAYSTSTGEIITVMPFLCRNFQVRSDGIYCDSTDDLLIKFDPSTGKTYQLSDRQITYINIAHERLLFWDFNKYYMSDLNGKNVMEL